MPTYDEIRSATESSYESGGGGRWDTERFTRERDERMYRGPAPPPAGVRERSRPPPPASDRHPRYDDRFERRVVEEDDSYGRRREGGGGGRSRRFVEEEDIYESRGSGPLVHHPRRERERGIPDPDFRPPRLVRRQSSLDTFDRQPARRVERAPPIRGMHHLHRAPAPPSPPSASHRRPSMGRYVERDEEEYEEIDIAEPDFYGDEEFRHFRERERRPVREEIVKERIVEKDRSYPRKGKTKMPKRLVLARAVQQLGYPYIDDGKSIIIQKALSKELIDEVVSLSRELRRRSDSGFIRKYESPPSPPVREREFVERVVVASPSPVRAERLVVEESPVRAERLVVEASPSRYRSPSRVRVGRYLERPDIIETRPRSVSVNFPRASSPVIVERRGDESGAVVMVERPRRSQHDISEQIRMLEEEKRMLQIERRPEIADSVDIITDKVVRRSDGQTDELLEVKKDKRPGDSRIIRAMMATLT